MRLARSKGKVSLKSVSQFHDSVPDRRTRSKSVSDDVGLFIDLMADVGWEGEYGESMGTFQA